MQPPEQRGSPDCTCAQCRGGRGPKCLHARPRPAQVAPPLDWSPGACSAQPLTRRRGPATSRVPAATETKQNPWANATWRTMRASHSFGEGGVETLRCGLVSQTSVPEDGVLSCRPGHAALDTGAQKASGWGSRRRVFLLQRLLRSLRRACGWSRPDGTPQEPLRGPRRRTRLQPKQPRRSRLSVTGGKPCPGAPGTPSHLIGQRGTTCAFLS